MWRLGIDDGRSLQAPLTLTIEPGLEERFVSRRYGAKSRASHFVDYRARFPFDARCASSFCAGEDEGALDLTRGELVNPSTKRFDSALNCRG